MKSKHKALAALIVSVLCWGFSFISIKIAVSVFPPMTLGAIRFAIALVFLFFIKKKLAPGEKVRKEDLPYLIGAGLMGVTFYFLFENNGVLLIHASEASIIIASIPVITMIAEAVREKIISRTKPASSAAEGTSAGKPSFLNRIILPVTGAVISISGVALVAGISFAITGSAKGYMFMGCACISWVCYCFCTRPLFDRHSRIFIVFWQSLIGFVGFLPFVVFEPSWQMPGMDVWAHVLFLGILCSALSYWMYSLALRDLGVGISTIFINFIPVITAIGGYFVLGERLEPLQWVGAVLVLGGVSLAMLAPSIQTKTNKNEFE